MGKNVKRKMHELIVVSRVRVGRTKESRFKA